MNRILFLTLFLILLPISVFAQRKPIKTITKPTPSKVQETTIEKAVTEKGKPVVLKSNGTWEFAPVEISQKPNTKPCDLTLKNVPSIKGLKLAMSKDEAEKTLKSEDAKQSPFYYTRASISPDGIQEYTFYIGQEVLKYPTEFWNIEKLELEFFKDELHNIRAEYSKSRANFTNEQLKSKISESFNLPLEMWTKAPFETEEVKCSEFTVQVYSGYRLTLTNLTTSRKIEENEKSKRETFKP